MALATPQGALWLSDPGGGAEMEGVASVRPLLRRAPADPGLAAGLRLDRVFVLEIEPGRDPAAVAAELRHREALVEAAGVERIGRAHAADAVPGDPLFRSQYSLRNTGQVVEGQAGAPGADINAVAAWDLSTGAYDVVVAVFDAGVSHSHPDLAPKLTAGWNFVDDTDETDDSYTSHGTHCAGIIAAATSNRIGVAGLAWSSRLMPVVVLNRYGFGGEGTLAEALVWAADQDVAVASVSLGFDADDGGATDQVLRAAVTYATLRGMLVCASTGNVAGAPISAPARYPEVVAVGATDNRDELWTNTTTGPEMGVVAPGVSIWSAWDSTRYDPGEDSYALRTGTSQACPHVAGVAALMRSVNAELDPSDAARLLKQTAKDLGPIGFDERYGHGRIDAGLAVAEASRRESPARGRALCTADFDNNGTVDSEDLLAYLNAFADQQWRADLAEPWGELNSLDLLAYVSAYAEGCDRD